MASKARWAAKAHKSLGLVVGLQLLFWTVSGLFFTLFPIERIRGEHLRAAPDYAAIGSNSDVALVSPADIVNAVNGEVEEITLKPFSTGPIYVVRRAGDTHVFDAQTGAQLSPIDEALARQVALDHWAGDGALVSMELIASPPREAASPDPLWRAEFQGRQSAVFWIDPQAGNVKAVRTTQWRVFDILWRFHIMDVTGEDRFDSWWLRIFAFLGLTIVIFGFVLMIDRARKRRLFK